jgi:nucleoside-diphosphate-sugar epimerase
MILLTGGTGFLGAHLAAELAVQGNEVLLLARSKTGRPAADRVARLLDWLALAEGPRRNIRLVEGRLDSPDLGLEPEALAALARSLDEVVHCASSTSFAERKRGEVEGVNLDGLRRVLDVAGIRPCRRFHLISTAYVAGRTAGPCPETLVRPPAFTNVYEETKCRAEWLAAERCAALGIPLTIYRPSIVYGHSETGRSLLFNALYYPVRTALFLKRLCEADIRERDGRKAADLGVRLDTDGWTVMPLRIRVEEEGGINLIPVDFFVRAFGAIRERTVDGVFHIVNSRPTRLADIIAYTQSLFRIRGISAGAPRGTETGPRNALEAVYDAYLEAYAPYMDDKRLFSAERSGPILDRASLRCPDLTYDSFKRCLDYALQCDWGARLFA